MCVLDLHGLSSVCDSTVGCLVGVLEKLPGEFSQPMGMVLHTLFNSEGNSFDKGIMLHAQSDDAAFVLRARLGGLLCGDKALTKLQPQGRPRLLKTRNAFMRVKLKEDRRIAVHLCMLVF